MITLLVILSLVSITAFVILFMFLRKPLSTYKLSVKSLDQTAVGGIGAVSTSNYPNGPDSKSADTYGSKRSSTLSTQENKSHVRHSQGPSAAEQRAKIRQMLLSGEAVDGANQLEDGGILVPPGRLAGPSIHQKTRISERMATDDVMAGLSDKEIADKHSISEAQVPKLINMLVEKGLIDSTLLAKRGKIDRQLYDKRANLFGELGGKVPSRMYEGDSETIKFEFPVSNFYKDNSDISRSFGYYVPERIPLDFDWPILEMELQAAGFYVEGKKRQRHTLEDLPINFQWNVHAKSSGNHDISIIVRYHLSQTAAPKEERITWSIRVVRIWNLTRQDVLRLSAVCMGVSLISSCLTVIKILAEFRLIF